MESTWNVVKNAESSLSQPETGKSSAHQSAATSIGLPDTQGSRKPGSLNEDRLVFSGPELHQLEFPPLRWYLEHYVPEEGIVLIYGKFGTYKTPLTLNIAKAIVSGAEELWGLAVHKASPVLYISADTPPRVVHPRMKTLGLADCPELDVALNAYPGIDVVNLAAHTEEAKKARELGALHQTKRYQAVFIDSLRAVHHLDDKESNNIRTVYGALASLFFGAVIVVIHHDKKTIPDATDDMKKESYSGSQALMNHATVGIKVEHSNKKYTVSWQHIKSQAGPQQENLTLTIQDEVAKSPEMSDWAPIIQEALAQGLSGGKLDAYVAAKMGVSTRTVQRHKGKLGDVGVAKLN